MHLSIQFADEKAAALLKIHGARTSTKNEDSINVTDYAKLKHQDEIVKICDDESELLHADEESLTAGTDTFKQEISDLSNVDIGEEPKSDPYKRYTDPEKVLRDIGVESFEEALENGRDAAKSMPKPKYTPPKPQPKNNTKQKGKKDYVRTTAGQLKQQSQNNGGPKLTLEDMEREMEEEAKSKQGKKGQKKDNSNQNKINQPPPPKKEEKKPEKQSPPPPKKEDENTKPVSKPQLQIQKMELDLPQNEEQPNEIKSEPHKEAEIPSPKEKNQPKPEISNQIPVQPQYSAPFNQQPYPQQPMMYYPPTQQPGSDNSELFKAMFEQNKSTMEFNKSLIDQNKMFAEIIATQMQMLQNQKHQSPPEEKVVKSEIPSNFASDSEVNGLKSRVENLENILKPMLKDAKNPKSSECNVCNKNPSISLCPICGKYLCQNCLNHKCK